MSTPHWAGPTPLHLYCDSGRHLFVTTFEDCPGDEVVSCPVDGCQGVVRTMSTTRPKKAAAKPKKPRKPRKKRASKRKVDAGGQP